MILAMILAAALTADQAAAIVRAASSMQSTAPQWLTSFEAAERISLRTGRPILIYNTQPGCAPCRRVEAWQQQCDLSGWVLLYVDTRQANPFRVAATPTHIVRIYGREWARWQGTGNVTDAMSYQRTIDSWRQAALATKPHR